MVWPRGHSSGLHLICACTSTYLRSISISAGDVDSSNAVEAVEGSEQVST